MRAAKVAENILCQVCHSMSPTSFGYNADRLLLARVCGQEIPVKINLDLFDEYVCYRMVRRPYNTDAWDVLLAALAYATVLPEA